MVQSMVVSLPRSSQPFDQDAALRSVAARAHAPRPPSCSEQLHAEVERRLRRSLLRATANQGPAKPKEPSRSYHLISAHRLDQGQNLMHLPVRHWRWTRGRRPLCQRERVEALLNWRSKPGLLASLSEVWVEHGPPARVGKLPRA